MKGVWGQQEHGGGGQSESRVDDNAGLPFDMCDTHVDKHAFV